MSAHEKYPHLKYKELKSPSGTKAIPEQVVSNIAEYVGAGNRVLSYQINYN